MTTEHKLYMYPSFFAPNIWNPFIYLNILHS